MFEGVQVMTKSKTENRISELEAKLALRADSNVQKKIKDFQNDIERAVGKLFGQDDVRGDFGSYEKLANSTGYDKSKIALRQAKLAVMKLAIQNKTEDGKFAAWPSVLWEREREFIRNELLEKMDLMQSLLMAHPRNTDSDVPCEGEE